MNRERRYFVASKVSIPWLGTFDRSSERGEFFFTTYTKVRRYELFVNKILKVIENKLMQVWVRFRMIKCLGYVKAPRAVDSTSFRSTCADLISGAKVFQGISRGISMLRFTNGNTQTSRNTWGTRIMSDNNTPRRQLFLQLEGISSFHAGGQNRRELRLRVRANWQTNSPAQDEIRIRWIRCQVRTIRQDRE